NVVRLLDRQTGKEIRKLNLGEIPQGPLIFSPDNARLACIASWDVLFWDVRTGKDLGGYRIHENAINQIAFLPGGSAVVSASYDYSVRFFDLRMRSEVRRIELPDGDQNLEFAMARDGKTFAVFGGDKDVRVYEIASGKQLALFRGHRSQITSADFSPDGTALATGCM